ncbi:mitogen-activated protein kinase kinase kinase [Coemansia sp. BCRC 34301]|nr:mitogen-activated protein kinase kinase kinase [Coemansia sp. BCRC 34301]
MDGQHHHHYHHQHIGDASSEAPGTPLPWSRDSVVRWAQQNGFAKFIPAFIQHGIEGRQFYTLRLETMRDMRIPNVSMQDLIQLNAAIYRLNTSRAQGITLQAPPTHASNPQMLGQTPTHASNLQTLGQAPTHASNSQILGQPLQPLRAPRPSWTVRRTDPQPTYTRQVQLTTNGMVAVPFPINTEVSATAAPEGTTGGSSSRTWSPRYNGALSTYRSRNSAHVEVDELPFVRPGQAWSPQLQPQRGAPPVPGSMPRRRSAVIDVTDDVAPEPPGLRLTPAPLPPRLAPTLPSVGPSANAPPSAGLPARYHGTNQPHSPYYAHGSFSYRGSAARPAYATVPQAGTSRYAAPVDLAGAEPSRYLTRRVRQHGSRNGMRGLFEHNAPAANVPAFISSAVPAARPPPPPPQPQPQSLLPADSRKPHPYSKEAAAARARRASISPVLSALKPVNYHIANLPDDLDSSESDSSSLPASAPPPAIITSFFARDFGISPCDTGESVVTPLSVVNVLPGTSISPPYTSPPVPQNPATSPDNPMLSMSSESGSNNRVRLQMAFGGDVEDLPSAGLRRAASHIRSPSMPASLESSSLAASEHNATTSGFATDRPHSTVDQTHHHDGLDNVNDYAPLPEPDNHYDLVENALSVASWDEDRGDGGELDVWDAEEIVGSYGDRSIGAPQAMTIFDAEEIDYSEDEFGNVKPSSSPVRIDAYETASIFSVPATQYEHDDGDDEGQQDYSAIPVPASNDSDHEQQMLPTPQQQQQQQQQQQSQTSDSVITPPILSGGSNSATQQSSSSAFKVKGVRHVLSYGADFDKTAATLLSSIKTDIAKKAAGGAGAGASRPVPNMPSAASIAAAIELHQLKQQQQQQQQQQQPVPRRHESDEHMASLSAERHTSRLSGFFGFGPRTHKPQQAPLPTTTTPQSQSPAAATASSSLGAAASAAGLRVVTDFQSLRGVGSGIGPAVGTTDPSSAEGKKSASPSTLPRRWRVPFRQRTNAAGLASGDHTHSQQLSSESPSSLAMERGHESEASTSATPKTESTSQRTFRRSRYRAGTTSDIESPLTAAALLSTMDRPYSMVDSIASASTSSAGGGVLTPGSIAAFRPPQPSLPPGAPQTAPRTISGSGSDRRRTQAHYQSSASPPMSSVFVRREHDSEFVQVDVSQLMSGAAIAERLVHALHGGEAMSSSLGLTGEHRFALLSGDGSQWPLESDSDLWMHCRRARAELPAAFVLCDGDSQQSAANQYRVRFEPAHLLGEGADGASSSGSESEICSAVPVFGRMPLAPFARVGFQGGGYDTTGSASPSSFVTATSYSPQVAVARGTGQLAIDEEEEEDDDDVILADRIHQASLDSSLSSLSRADSWTLMFVNKEFVVAKPSPPLSQDLAATSAGSTLAINDDSMEHAPATQILDADIDDDNDLWGGAAPTTGVDDDDDPVAEAMRADLAERHAADSRDYGDDEEEEDDDGRSVASSTRTLPSTMRFTRGMRATLLERRPSRNVHGRPTADMIGEQLDEYFPDHDLDRPIVQSVPMDEGGLLPSHEFHIILDEDDGAAAVAYQPGSRGRRHLAKVLGSEEDGNDSGGGGGGGAHGVGRRKSVRMLVQETRRQRRPRSRVVTDKRAAEPAPVVAVAKPPRPVVRRQSTKLWGCIPEEIRPWDERPAQAAGAVQGAGVPRGNDEIVRRALSLLRKPEPNPQAEKDIVEAAIKCGDSSTVGSTRAHFVHERARLQQMSNEGDVVGGASVNDAARALFAKYGIATAGIKIQWIKGKLIGKGSFGHVYVAINAATGEVIAVKQIRLPASLCAATDEAVVAPTVGSSIRKRRGGRAAGLLEEAIRMMYTEVELLRDLDHENVVQLLGFEVADGVMSMFLEYVPGGTVQSLVQQHGPLPESVVHSFLRQIVAGLGYLHSSGILHRDIKGANILVDETGTCKISDFGVSRKVDCTSLAAAAAMAGGDGVGGRKRSIKGKILGTVPFMAPEVARSSQYTAAADIWSLGCVVVQMWSGRGPWDELQEPQVFFKLGRGEAPPIPDDLTEPGLDFCKNCFAADPRARWTAAELGCMQFAQVPCDYEYPYAC